MTAPNEALLVALRRSAQGLVERDLSDLEDVLTRIVAAATQTVPGADGGGIACLDREAVRGRHATADVIREIDQVQDDLGEGPSVTAAADPPSSGMVIAHDLGCRPDTDRWPRFAAVAVARGYRSVMSTQLSADPRAALTLYSRTAHAFDEQACVMAGLFATQAAVLLHGAERAANLERALDSRDLIGQAKGILMERFTITSADAFDLLVTSSQETNLKLVEVARWLVEESATTRASAGRALPSDGDDGPGDFSQPTLRVM
ncbi:hypothetical protein Acsp06_51140 [Actinomycetospora sp. NBRC 106375]|uniref:GAF and ANTAR domain-containing protein n=1 Tax=Actinomycetospora sp. NBRC 106375 TaxID=3032207 RepID=UPI0024A00D88|nr:GAF and ANTAR domain-containing protein [Actinomycetospora sp. NBRC 106375]GLZ48929.1 hypothetical protein Acsp06_51140 [Actinomycetospora sp. NBRC 106375]